VMQVEGESDKVIAVVQKGYMLNDRVLRPARVKVGNGSASSDELAKDK
jgi:molecular chaperone GrpE (heat shock protein)